MNRKFIPLAGSLLIVMMQLLSVGFGVGRAQEPSRGEPSDGEAPISEHPEDMSSMFRGTVVEVINAGRYAYIQVETDENRVWVAVPSFDGKIGDAVVVPPGVPVADFKSQKLDRKFDMIYFVGGIRRVGEETTQDDRTVHPPMEELEDAKAITEPDAERPETTGDQDHHIIE